MRSTPPFSRTRFNFMSLGLSWHPEGSGEGSGLFKLKGQSTHFQVGGYEPLRPIDRILYSRWGYVEPSGGRLEFHEVAQPNHGGEGVETYDMHRVTLIRFAFRCFWHGGNCLAHLGGRVGVGGVIRWHKCTP